MARFRRKRTHPFPESQGVHLKLKKAETPFLKRHARAFSIVGAMIILATYVARDVYRENLRELIDSTSRVRVAYNLRAGIDDIRQSLGRAPYFRKTPTSESARQNSDAIGLEQYRNSLGNTVEYEYQLEEQIYNAAVLCDAVEDKERCKENDKTILEKIDHFANATSDELRNRLNAVSGPVEISRSREMVRDMYGSAFKINNEANGFIQTTVETVTNRKEIAEHRYKAVTLASYCLYGLGWILALAGRFVGVGAEASE